MFGTYNDPVMNVTIQIESARRSDADYSREVLRIRHEGDDYVLRTFGLYEVDAFLVSRFVWILLFWSLKVSDENSILIKSWRDCHFPFEGKREID